MMRSTAPSQAAQRRGFTVIEAIASIVVLSIIGTLASNIILTIADSYFDSTTRADLHAEASMSLDRIMRELRAIPPDSAAAGVAADIDATSATSIRWNASSGISEITLTGTNLTFAEDGGAAAVLQMDVSSVAFQFFNESNAAIGPVLSGAGCDAIRRIEVTLTLTREGISETLRGRIFVRSTMEGVGS